MMSVKSGTCNKTKKDKKMKRVVLSRKSHLQTKLMDAVYNCHLKFCAILIGKSQLIRPFSDTEYMVQLFLLILNNSTLGYIAYEFTSQQISINPFVKFAGYNGVFYVFHVNRIC